MPEVDVPEFLARVLQEHAPAKTGYLFAASTGRPLMQRNVLGVLHDITPSADFAPRYCGGRGSPKTLFVCGWGTRRKPLLTSMRMD
ncbi:MAG: hypothetical protein DMG38_18235 [Acidobacteria bacterium]|nr:MAG: hypothetical protein DMG38_18235 [Acidobacteriota bacterium]